MNKAVLKGALLTVALSGLTATSAQALSITSTHTGDNIIGAVWLQDGTTQQSFTQGTNYNNWQIADTITIDNLIAGHDYSLIYIVQNLGLSSNTNPGGFLAEIDYGGTENLFSSAEWTYVDDADKGLYGNFNDPSWNWQSVTSYGANGSDTIWTTVNGGPIAGISSLAEWIWDAGNFPNSLGALSSDENQVLYIRADFTTVPEPSTMILFGTGLLGIASLSRKRQRLSIGR